MPTLTNRQRFSRTFNGEPVDHTPFLDVMGFWDASLERWKTEGLSQNASAATVRKMVGFDGGLGFFLPVNGFVCPAFEPQVVRQEGEKTFTRNRWGAIELNFAGSELLPITIEGPVSDRKSWDRIKPFLQPDISGRLPDHWSTLCDQALVSEEPGTTRDYVSAIVSIDGFPFELADTAGSAWRSSPTTD